MFDYKKELAKLLADEPAAPMTDDFSVLISEGSRLLAAFEKKQEDISLQIEEIFDIVHSNSEADTALSAEKAQAKRFINAIIGLSDMIEVFLHFSEQSGNAGHAEQARIMWSNANALLGECALSSFGDVGSPLDPALHSVHAAVNSAYPDEHIASVLQSGYRYKGSVLRKASVVVSTGAPPDPGRGSPRVQTYQGGR